MQTSSHLNIQMNNVQLSIADSRKMTTTLKRTNDFNQNPAIGAQSGSQIKQQISSMSSSQYIVLPQNNYNKSNSLTQNTWSKGIQPTSRIIPTTTHNLVTINSGSVSSHVLQQAIAQNNKAIASNVFNVNLQNQHNPNIPSSVITINNSGTIINSRPVLKTPINPNTNKGAFVPLTQLIAPKTNHILVSKVNSPKSTSNTVIQLQPRVPIPSSQEIKKTILNSNRTIYSSSLNAAGNKQFVNIASANISPASPINISSTRVKITEKVKPNNVDKDYMQVIANKAAPVQCFKHVQLSEKNGFQPGMKLEVANMSVPNTYWVASVMETLKKHIRLRYDGYNNNDADDFIVSISADHLHPIGWCAQNGKVLQPPNRIKHKHSNWAEFLVKNLIGARTVPSHLLTPPGKGKSVIEMIETKMLLEIQDAQHPQHVWIAHVEKNVGGRLLLRYEGMTNEDSHHDFWLFYLNIRLHQLGWGKDHGLTMKPPDHIRKKYASGEQWAYVLSLSLKGITEKELVPAYIFQEQVQLQEHGIKECGKLAVLDPINPTKVRPATVVNIVSKYFFLAELDRMEKSTVNHAFLCHSSSSGIFSIDWCQRYNIPITMPDDQTITDFNWGEYLRNKKTTAVPTRCFVADSNHRFVTGMMLEAGNPFNLQEICLARVLAVHGNIIRLQLNNALECFVPASSHDIFPIGWCEKNKYPLSTIKMWRTVNERKSTQDNLGNISTQVKPLPIDIKQIPDMQSSQTVQETKNNKTMDIKIVPVNTMPILSKTMPEKTPDTTDSLISFVNPKQNSDLWCPAICFNCTCNIGTMLNSANLSKVPQRVGPGNIILVLKEVLSLLVGAANNPIRLLKEFQAATASKSRQECEIKAKYNGKKYKAPVYIVDRSSSVPKFLNSITALLRCCPNLLTIREPLKICPLQCIQAVSDEKSKLLLKRKRSKSLQRMRISKVMKRRLKGNIGNEERISKSPTFDSSPQKSEKELPLNEISITEDNITNNNHNSFDENNNPFLWSVEEVCEYIQSSECAPLAKIFRQQEIDGQSLLLLTLPVVQDCMELKLGPALKLCKVIEEIKFKFYEKYAL